MLAWFRYTAWLHALLPMALWLAQRGVSDPDLLGNLIFGVHGLGLLALGAAYPWWRSKGDELILLLVANHLVTFCSGTLWMLLVTLCGG